jgi:hypothetical protein
LRILERLFHEFVCAALSQTATLTVSIRQISSCRTQSKYNLPHETEKVNGFEKKCQAGNKKTAMLIICVKDLRGP